MQERLANFLFAPQTWIQQANGSVAIARHYQNKIAPLSRFNKANLEHFGDKLILLSDAEWGLLGLTVSCVPFCGQIQKNLNAKLVRTVMAHLSNEQIAALDALELGTRPSFLLSAKTWEDPQVIINGGIASAMAALEVSDYARQILEHRFSSHEATCGPLTPALIEDLCKIALPSLLWLYV